MEHHSMKLLRLQKIFSSDIQLFHLIDKTEWKQQEGWSDKLLNFHIVTFCGIDRIKKKGDDYVTFEKKKHTKKLCPYCYKEYRSRKGLLKYQ